MLNEGIWIALIGFVGTAIGTFGGILASAKLTNYRLSRLEEKVDKHNSVIERTYRLEESVALHEEKIKVANHRIDDLERGGETA